MTNTIHIIVGGCAFLVVAGAAWYLLHVREYVPVSPFGTSTVPEMERAGGAVNSTGTERTPTRSTPSTKPAEVTPTPTSAHALDLSGQGLTAVPAYVFDRTDLESLNVSHNALHGALQAEVRHLAALRSLDLSYNAFTGVPAEVGQLAALEYLNLSHNPITGLPYELGNLSHLKRLDLRGTQYASADLAIIREHLPASTEVLTD